MFIQMAHSKFNSNLHPLSQVIPTSVTTKSLLVGVASHPSFTAPYKHGIWEAASCSTEWLAKCYGSTALIKN